MYQKILIIEDNEQNMYMLTYLLESNNYKVFQSFNGPTGITLAQEHHPDAYPVT
jgi:two-component system cell cycle response regulator DivK